LPVLATVATDAPRECWIRQERWTMSLELSQRVVGDSANNLDLRWGSSLSWSEDKALMASTALLGYLAQGHAIEGDSSTAPEEPWSVDSGGGSLARSWHRQKNQQGKKRARRRDGQEWLFDDGEG
jgi:hypothetical protein